MASQVTPQIPGTILSYYSKDQSKLNQVLTYGNQIYAKWEQDPKTKEYHNFKIPNIPSPRPEESNSNTPELITKIDQLRNESLRLEKERENLSVDLSRKYTSEKDCIKAIETVYFVSTSITPLRGFNQRNILIENYDLQIVLQEGKVKKVKPYDRYELSNRPKTEIQLTQDLVDRAANWKKSTELLEKETDEVKKILWNKV